MEDFNIYTREHLIKLLTETTEKLEEKTRHHKWAVEDLKDANAIIAHLKDQAGIPQDAKFFRAGDSINIRAEKDGVLGFCPYEITKNGFYTHEQLEVLFWVNEITCQRPTAEGELHARRQHESLFELMAYVDSDFPPPRRRTGA